MAAESTAEVSWRGDLAKGGGRFTSGSGALGTQEVSWVSRTERSEGKASPEELIAGALRGSLEISIDATLEQS